MLGELRQVGDQHQLVFTRRLPHGREKVWRALIEPQHLKAWFPARIDGERVAGAKLTFVFEHNEGPSVEGEMLAFDPPTLLEFTWGGDTLRFELQPDEGGGTVLTLRNTFDEQGKAARDAAGWHTCLDALAHELDGEKPRWSTRDRWNEVHPKYVGAFGPAASTIAPPAGS
jgi:uncharacterized protein YndB with AHSA1/START domain